MVSVLPSESPEIYTFVNDTNIEQFNNVIMIHVVIILA